MSISSKTIYTPIKYRVFFYFERACLLHAFDIHVHVYLKSEKSLPLFHLELFVAFIVLLTSPHSEQHRFINSDVASMRRQKQ